MLVFDSMQEVTKDFGKKALKAGVKTVNIVAATARKNAISEIEKKFTLRNRFTVNSVRFTQCPPSVGKLSDVKSSVGILEQAGYMARQETGEHERQKRRDEQGAGLKRVQVRKNKKRIREKTVVLEARAGGRRLQRREKQRIHPTQRHDFPRQTLLAQKGQQAFRLGAGTEHEIQIHFHAVQKMAQPVRLPSRRADSENLHAKTRRRISVKKCQPERKTALLI